MQRSHCETENVQFVQELAEVDGPFESPININFRDLTKLELPSLVWNRSDTCPKKMKITNTGHTVIISGKWKCERPFLTGGPLEGKYVFSQIHFHWGQDDCKGSEHLVCGEGFPLEMHVAHFKTEYLTQECALREKDGMVVLVYLFKLQEEPNTSLTKILSILPSIRQASSSQTLDPRPILSLCNPFTDDYFMYWGSIITSSCAHILLWLVCREPFGISRDQVNEFRKILDSSQQPICRNNRDPQPLHKRNVFHVNASKFLDCPLLPVKKIVGCFCGKGSENNESNKSISNQCCCQASAKHQEDIEGNYAETGIGPLCLRIGDRQSNRKPSKDFFMHQSLFVNRATVRSAPLLPKLFEKTYLGQLWSQSNARSLQPEGTKEEKLVSQSCCFIPVKEMAKVRKEESERIKSKTFDSMKALSQIMESLEALKNQTFKKLKEIESINQEIKGMKSFCEDAEDKKWLKKIERIIKRQRRFTLRSSQGCLTDLKKLARECNCDQLLDGKMVSLTDNKNRMLLLNNSLTDKALPCSEACPPAGTKEKSSKLFDVDKAARFSSEAQKLIHTFFEDIQENDDLKLTLEKDNELKRVSSMSYRLEQAEDSASIVSLGKGYITKKMFNLGKLGDRFFAEVSTEDLEHNNNKDMLLAPEGGDAGNPIPENEIPIYEAIREVNREMTKGNGEEIIPLHRANINVELSEVPLTISAQNSSIKINENDCNGRLLEIPVDSESIPLSEMYETSYFEVPPTKRSIVREPIDEFDELGSHLTRRGLFNNSNADGLVLHFKNSSTSISLESTETQRMIIAKFRRRQSKKNIREKKSSMISKKSSKGLYEKAKRKKQKLCNINFEGYYIKKRNPKNKRRKFQKERNSKESSCDMSSLSRDGFRSVKYKYKWKNMTKTRFKLQIQKTSDSTIESAAEYSLVRPDAKKSKLNSPKKVETLGEDNGNSPPVSGCSRTSDTQKTSRTFVRVHESQTLDTSIKEIVADLPPAGNAAPDDKAQKTPAELRAVAQSDKPRPTSGGSAKRADTPRNFETRPSRSGGLKASEQPKRVIKNQKSRLDVRVPAVKKLLKHRSFTYFAPRFKSHFSDSGKRTFMQCSYDRRNKNIERTTDREPVELQRKLESSKMLSIPRVAAIKNIHCSGLSESVRKSEGSEKLLQQQREFEVGFFTTSRSACEEKPSSGNHGQEATNVLSRNTSGRCDIEKYHFLDKELQESKAIAETNSIEEEDPKPIQEISLQRTESNKSFSSIAPNMKGDANPPKADKQELSASLSYTTVRKAPKSRPHSVESLSSLTKACKKRRKKRPHCIKRNSRHYIRKNSCVFKKPMKGDNKVTQPAYLPDEEQLKIISVNVAKYLKQKFGERNLNLNLKRSCIIKETEQEIAENLEMEEEIQELLLKEYEKKEEPVKLEGEREKQKESVKGTPEDAANEEPAEPKLVQVPSKERKTVSPRPPLNFIKLNKLMAGKYRRTPPSPESKAENQQVIKKEMLKEKTIKKKKEKVSSGKDTVKSKVKEKETVQMEMAKDKNANKKPTKTNRLMKSPPSAKKTEMKKKERKFSIPQSKKKKSEIPVTKTNDNKKSSSPTAVKKSPSEQKFPSRMVPTYMMTPYAPPPKEIVESQQQQINKCLVNVPKKGVDPYLPEVLYESKPKKNDTIFAKDLDDLIKLQMCLNNEIAANIENSMNYIKNLLSQDYSGTAIMEKAPLTDPLDCYDVTQSGLILIEMNDDLDRLSACAGFPEESPRNGLFDVKNLCNLESFHKDKGSVMNRIPKDSGDSKVLSPVFFHDFDGDEEYHSDSSYNCEISITLNAGSNEVEGENYGMGSCSRVFSNNCIYDLKRESNLSELTCHLDGGSSTQSVVFKPIRKKRKENEISSEMKRKLLEILEGEISREMSLNCIGSSGRSSDALTLRWDESSEMNRSESNESNSDNTEVLAQISETMRQYLCDYKKRSFAGSAQDRHEDSKSEVTRYY